MKTMKPNQLHILAATFALHAIASSMYAQTILDFEDGTNRIGQLVGTYYAAQGVTFSNAIWIDAQTVAPQLAANWFSGQVGIGTQHGPSPFDNECSFPGLDHPIVINFDVPATSVTIGAYDVGENGARLRVFDALGQQLGASQTAVGSGAGIGNRQTLSVVAPGIRRIALDQYLYHGAPDGVTFDELRFSTNAIGATLRCAMYAGIEVEGPVGRPFRVEYSTDLTTTNWTTLTNLVLTSSPQLLFDPTSANKPKRFYRAIELP